MKVPFSFRYSNICQVLFITGIMGCVGFGSATAQEIDSEIEGSPVEISDVRFGSPDAVENILADDRAVVPSLTEGLDLQPWFDWKDDLEANTGLSFGIDYTSLGFASTSDADIHKSSGGIARLFGTWSLVNPGTPEDGALVFKVETRNRYSQIPPGGWGLGALGYVGVFGGPYSDQQGRWTNLYWRQRLNQGRSTVIAGYLDVTDYVDTFIGGSPWTGFTNLAFSTGSAAVFLPNDATLGIAGATMLGDNFYVIGGITNAYADPTHPFDDSFDRFFNDHEHFKSIEFGWTASQGRIYNDNTHITLWHVDESVEAGTQDGWGIAFSHVRQFGDWTPFIRGGWTDDGGSLLQKSVSVGFLYSVLDRGDQFGFGLNWGQVNKTTFLPGLDDQYTMEAYYRAQITPQIAVTPSIEYVHNPALSSVDEDFWLFGLRARIAL